MPTAVRDRRHWRQPAVLVHLLTGTVPVVTHSGADAGRFDYTSMDLLYFRDLIEGRDAVSWTSWWSQNEGRLRMRLPRAEFLRLKFHSLEG